MSLRRSLLSCLAFAVLAAGLSTTVFAGPPNRRVPPDPTDARMPSRSHNDDALSDSVRRVERNTRAQVLSAERVPFDGRDVNRIKTVDDRGRVHVIMDDPQAPTPQPDSP